MFDFFKRKPQPTLPQDDPDPQARAKRIAQAREAFVWDHTYLAPLPLLYIDTHGKTGAEAGVVDIELLPESVRPPDRYLRQRARATDSVIVEALRTFREAKTTRFTSSSDYYGLLTALPRPLALERVPSDASFSWQRLAGLNPMLLTRLSALPPDLRVTDAQARHGLGGRTLAEAMAEGDLYACDYRMLAEPTPLPLRAGEGAAKYMVAPIALFAVHRSEGAATGPLRPVAIQLGRDDAAPVLLPSDGEAWAYAKLMVQIADFNYHEMSVHLCRTHFIEEGFAVAAARTLDPSHPIALLLAPHVQILLFNNFEGRELLVNPGGPVDTLLAPTLEGSLELVRRSYAEWSIDDWHVPKELESRGMGEGCTLDTYPYRDDGLPIWRALTTYVRAWVDLYYLDDAAVDADPEIQAFWGELTSPEGAHVKGLPPTLTGRAALADLLTRFIWTCGPQHSAINFPQFDYAGFVPNLSGASFQPIPRDKAEMTSARWFSSLPPPHVSELQTQTVFELTAYRFDKLGDYADTLADPRAQALVRAFAAQLAVVETQTAARNANLNRRAPYTYLVPSLVLNSTSI